MTRMLMPRFGRNPDELLRLRIATLRSKGLTFTQIGKRLGISRQGAYGLLIRSKQTVEVPGICCRECKKEICPWKRSLRGGIRRNPPTWCLVCLAKHPEATLGQRIASHRLQARLTRFELAKKVGVSVNFLTMTEQDRVSPRWKFLKKLVRLFGTCILDCYNSEPSHGDRDE